MGDSKRATRLRNISADNSKALGRLADLIAEDETFTDLQTEFERLGKSIEKSLTKRRKQDWRLFIDVLEKKQIEKNAIYFGGGFETGLGDFDIRARETHGVLLDTLGTVQEINLTLLYPGKKKPSEEQHAVLTNALAVVQAMHLSLLDQTKILERRLESTN